MSLKMSDLMPRIQIGPHSLSRLIIGGNPFSGNSHQTSEADREMREYHSAARILATLRRAEGWGINTFQSRGDNHMMRLVNDHWRAGGRLNWIAQTASERADVFANISQIARAGAIGIYHHGARTDQLWHQGRIDEVEPYLRAIRDTGCLVGLGTHIPQVLAYADERSWDLDFYMASLYNLSRPLGQRPSPAGQRTTDERFQHDDREAMLAAIRNTVRPVLAFKILGAGRLATSDAALRSAFARTLAGIKPTDAIVVGVFTKYGDQVARNARLVLELAGTTSLGRRPRPEAAGATGPVPSA
ncbi:MAG: hypothetical protein HPY83_13025 [Anaerolineae bacterium]|nr:hypothetical protein [Anaerolineae bacterium]